MKYLLSPQDLMALDLVPELVAAGVSCFKIEGRLKGPEYVALTTQLYRQAVDAAWEGLQAQQGQGQQQHAGRGGGSAGAGGFELSQDMRWRLEQVGGAACWGHVVCRLARWSGK
jgi:collagenase-like PrtC family protease